MIDLSRAGTIFFCGIGGSGMSALAQIMRERGWDVHGSDRSRDRGETPEKFAKLERMGMALYPQDGSGAAGVSCLVVSSAIESSIPDVKAAQEGKIPIYKRAEILAALFNRADQSIAVGGTSGKSTVTAMTGWILNHAGKNPTIVNGAQMGNFEGPGSFGNAVTGDDNLYVAEVDESDGSIAFFKPSVAVLTNISLDHRPMNELQALFANFIGEASECAVINLDDEFSAALLPQAEKALTFSLENPETDFCAQNITPHDDGVSFAVNGVPVRLYVPGRHNVANALAAMAAVSCTGVRLEDAAAALEEFRGTHRRFEIVGTANGITVIDDFAHNPDKIAATLNTLCEKKGRVWAIFQPHGFGPTKLMRRELVAALAQGLRAEDVLIMPEIYYAGGTASRDISSADIVADVKAQGREAVFIPQRNDIIKYLGDHTGPGDRIIIMGARDDTLPGFARAILGRFSNF